MDFAGMKRRELQALCKRHGLPAGGTNAALVARLDAALSGDDGAEEEVAEVAAGKGCLKQKGGDAAEAKKVTFAASEAKPRRLRSRVLWSPIAAKTRGKSAQACMDSAAEDDSVSAEVGADVPVRRSRRKSVSIAEAEEVGEAVAVDRKRKRKNQDNDEGVAVSTQVGVSSRVTRRASLAGAAVVLPPVVEKKRGRGKAAGGGNKVAAGSQDSEPDVQNSAQIEVSARVARSRSIAPVVISPTVVENKRRKTGDARTNVELPTVSGVPRNDAPVTRSLRNRAVQVNTSIVDETHSARQLENKTQPSRPPTRRHQQVSSSVEDNNQEQIAAPNKAPLLRRSGRNHSEDAEKQPEVKEPVKRSTRKSVALATLEKVENDLIEEKKPETHVRRSMRKSIALVKDIKCIGEKIHNANSEDAVKQPATEGPVRGSRRKSVVSKLHEKEKGLIVEKNMEAHEGRSMRKPVMPVKDIKAVGKGIQNAKGKGVEKQFVVKQPTRRSSRKSVLPDMLENNSGLQAAQMNAEMNVRKSTRKSVLPNMLNEENQDDERQQEVKKPIRRSRRSVAAVPLEEQSNGLHEEKMSKTPRRSTRKSVALNEVEKVSVDHTEIVAREQERVGEEGLKLRKHRRSSLEISSSTNDSWRKQQNAEIPNEKDSTGGTQQASNSTTSKGRSSKKRRATAPEVMSVKEANDDIIIMEATKDADKATHEYKESSSRVQESGQVNATREELSSGPLPVTVTLTHGISTAQSVPVVIPGSESGDNANESSDKSKQDHSDIQAVDTHLSETSGELDLSSRIAGLVPHNCVVSDDKALMSEDVLSINFAIGDCGEQSPVSGEGRVSLEADASESGEKNLPDIMSTGLNPKSPQHDIDIIAEVAGKGDLKQPSPCSTTPECKPKCGLPEETVLPPKNMGSQSSAEQSPFGLESLFSQKNIYESMGSATSRTKNGFDDSKDCHVKSALGNTCVSEPYSHDDTEEGTSKNDVCMQTPQQDNGMEGSPEANLDEERVLSVFSLDAKHKEEVINSEDVAYEGEGSKKLVHSLDLKASSENTDVNGPDGNACGISDTVLSSALHALANGNYEICLGSNTDVVHQGHNDECGDDTEDIIEDASAKSIDRGIVLLSGKERSNLKDGQLNSKLEGAKVVESGLYFNKDIGNILDSGSVVGEITPSGSGLSKDSSKEYRQEALDGFSMETSLDGSSTCGEKIVCRVDATDNKGACSEEAAHAMKNYAGACSSNPKLMEHMEEVINTEEVACEGEGSKKLVHSEELKASSEKANVNGPDGNAYGITDAVLSSALHTPANDKGGKSLHSVELKASSEKIDVNGPDLDQQSIFQVQLGDVQEGDLQKPSPCSTTPECKPKCGLLEETVLPPKNTGSLSIVEQSPFGLESLFSQKNIDESMGSATSHTKNGFDGSKDCHVKSALGNTHVSEPYSHNDTEEGISKNDVCIQTPQQDNGMEGSPQANLDEDWVLSVFSLDAKHIEEVINTEEVACEGEGSKKLVHSEELKASSEKANVNGPDVNAYGVTDAVLSSALHTPANDKGSKKLHSEEPKASSEKIDVNGPDVNAFGITDAILSSALHTLANDNYGTCLGSNTDVLHHGPNDQFSDDTEGIIEDAPPKYIERGTVLLSGKERSNLKDGQLNSKMEGAQVVESSLYFNKNIGNILDSGSVVGEITPSCSGLSKDSSKEYRQEIVDGFSMEASLDGSSTCGLKIVCRVDAIENPSTSLASTVYMHEGALSEEALRTMKNYAVTCSSNPRELVMELQSLSSEGNTKESDPHDGLAFPSAENSGDESINVEQQDELIGCSNTVVLHQGHNHKDRSNVDRVEQVASEPCTNDIVETAAKCKESGLVLPPSEEKSNLNNGHLNPILESPNTMVSGINCDKDVCNTSDNGSIVVVVGKRTTSGSGLPEDCRKDYFPRQGLLDGFSVEPSFQGTIFGKTIVSGVAGIGNPSSSLATPDPDCKCEGALSEQAVCRMKNYTGTSSVDPKHLLMDLQSLYSEGSTEKSDLQVKRELYLLPKDFHIDSCQKQEVPEVLSSPKSPGTSLVDPKHLLMDLQSLYSEGSPEKSDLQVKRDLYLLPKDFHIDSCQKQEVPEVLSSPKSPEESAKFQCVSVSGPGPCQQPANESTSVQLTYNIETFNQDHEDYNQNNEDQTTPGILSSSVPEVVEIEQSEMEIGLIPAAEASVLPVPDKQLNNKLEGNEVDGHNCGYDKDFSSLFDTDFMNREASNLHIDDCMDLSTEDNHPNDLPAPRSPEQLAYFQNNDSGSVGRGIDEIHAKLQSFKVSSTVKGSYIAMSAPRPKPGDSMSQTAMELLRNIENTPAVKAGHPVKPKVDGKDSSRRALQPISGRPREH